ncbi:MAG: serine/threonine protein kinase [Deltaproteobacteria bacterium]|nr:serine/threonine protein kinase [Kofleriaceae bacterium]
MSDDSTLAALANTTPASGAPGDGELAGGTIVAERWTIVRFLARGGMGAVYEAHDRLLDGPVALKTLRSGMAHERFVREIQLARKVSHPNVCRIHDAGRHGGLSFLTMELLAGEPLSARLERGPMSVVEARPILADLAAALDAAHAAGVIHRDFKPHNVMLVRRGGTLRAVVTDFGIARAADDTGDAALTADGELIGTPAYMAPEQVNGKPVTAATDVFSFGVVAYQMVTGALPFTGQNARGGRGASW